MNRDDLVGYAVPAFTLGLGLLAWEGIVRYFAIPPDVHAEGVVIAYIERAGFVRDWVAPHVFVLRSAVWNRLPTESASLPFREVTWRCHSCYG